MKTLLKHISNIQTGFFAKAVSNGDVIYLQAKHFDENGLLKAVLFPDIKNVKIPDYHFLNEGDVVFAAKGNKNFAACIKNLNYPAVASTSFFVIRISDKFTHKLLTEFLSWQINHPVSQSFLKANAIGTSIVSISKVVLGELQISIPPVKVQNAILKLVQLQKKEKALKKEIDALKEKQLQRLILNSIN